MYLGVFLKAAGFAIERSWCGSWFQACGPANRMVRSFSELCGEKSVQPIGKLAYFYSLKNNDDIKY